MRETRLIPVGAFGLYVRLNKCGPEIVYSQMDRLMFTSVRRSGLGDLVSHLLLPFLMGVICYFTCGGGPGELGGDAEAWGASI